MKKVKNDLNISGISMIKILATLLVVSIHQLGRIGFYDATVGNSETMTILIAMYPLLLCGVPLFLIASGYLLSAREINALHYKKSLFFLTEVIVIISVRLIVMAIYSHNVALVSFPEIMKSIFNPPYYVGLYFSLYVIAPFLNRLYFSLTVKEKKILIYVSFFVISISSFVNNFFDIALMDARFFGMWMVLYYIIGIAISDFKPKINPLVGGGYFNDYWCLLYNNSIYP